MCFYFSEMEIALIINTFTDSITLYNFLKILIKWHNGPENIQLALYYLIQRLAAPTTKQSQLQHVTRRAPLTSRSW